MLTSPHLQIVSAMAPRPANCVESMRPARSCTRVAHMCLFFVHFIVKPGLQRASLVAQLVKNLPAMQETPVRFLGWEDLLEEG